LEAAAATTPTIRLAVETIPSLAPRTAAGSQPDALHLVPLRVNPCARHAVASPSNSQSLIGNLQPLVSNSQWQEWVENGH
jgi:hypothetical protein